MGQFTWWEETTCPEGELSIAIREPGSPCVPVTGMTVGWRHKLSAEVWAINLVGLHDLVLLLKIELTFGLMHYHINLLFTNLFRIYCSELRTRE